MKAFAGIFVAIFGLLVLQPLFDQVARANIGILERLAWGIPLFSAVVFVFSFCGHLIFYLRDDLMVGIDQKPDNGLARLRQSLLLSRHREAYRQTIRKLLLKTSRWLPPAARAPRQAGAVPTALKFAFSNNSQGFCLLLAIVYPALSMFSQYAIFSGNGSFGELAMFDPSNSLPRRVSALFLMIISVSMFLFSGRSLDFAFGISDAFGSVYSGILYVLFFVLTTLVSILVADSMTAAHIVIIFVGAAVLISRAFRQNFAFGSVFAFSAAFAVIVSNSIVGPYLIVLFFIIIIALSMSAFVALLSFRNFANRFSFFILYIFSSVAALSLLYFFDLNLDIFISSVVFLFILPMANGFWDYISFGCTRMLVWYSISDGISRKNRRRSSIRPALISVFLLIVDLFVAVCILISLGASVIALLALLNWTAVAGQNASPLIDIHGKLDMLRDPSQSPHWVYVMHFSTFIPTLIHIIIMMFYFPVRLIPQGWNNRIAAKITPSIADRPIDQLLVATYQSLRWTLPITLTFVGFYSLVTWGAKPGQLSTIGTFFLNWIEWWAHFIGAI
ncbi:hypothetical protein [Parvularcula sp. LCG005]|uniref:hypothetical protein n=1 Tax=Parvularcula sp. LCG005 TaxID=3078805 RepID=UPI002943E2BC|nr:hypothetical protein [Parvularcula sp. LCG005]WOI54198.1 hypothetical protein RUI03_04170 [Parvularcula sp. LCG005]